jgi:hypothetical protein
VPDPLDSEGGSAQPTPKTKPGNPVRSRKARISPEVLALIDQQGDGRNGGKH